MLRHTLTSLALFAVLATTLSGCVPGYGYGMRPGYYGGGRPVYSYRTPTYRTAPGWGGGGGWGYTGGGDHGGGYSHH